MMSANAEPGVCVCTPNQCVHHIMYVQDTKAQCTALLPFLVFVVEAANEIIALVANSIELLRLNWMDSRAENDFEYERKFRNRNRLPNSIA